ncbi:hypothetical protein TRVA0_044S01222 [Trichomonascus vanleenenianus]|uniref:uncharacterized protein n=1 Tax=Trichomonascus vanleenenianus TaxID=2268995 RepID=UPI003ECA58E9
MDYDSDDGFEHELPPEIWIYESDLKPIEPKVKTWIQKTQNRTTLLDFPRGGSINICSKEHLKEWFSQGANLNQYEHVAYFSPDLLYKLMDHVNTDLRRYTTHHGVYNNFYYEVPPPTFKIKQVWVHDEALTFDFKKKIKHKLGNNGLVRFPKPSSLNVGTVRLIETYLDEEPTRRDYAYFDLEALRQFIDNEEELKLENYIIHDGWLINRRFRRDAATIDEEPITEEPHNEPDLPNEAEEEPALKKRKFAPLKYTALDDATILSAMIHKKSNTVRRNELAETLADVLGEGRTVDSLKMRVKAFGRALAEFPDPWDYGKRMLPVLKSSKMLEDYLTKIEAKQQVKFGLREKHLMLNLLLWDYPPGTPYVRACRDLAAYCTNSSLSEDNWRDQFVFHVQPLMQEHGMEIGMYHEDLLSQGFRPSEIVNYHVKRKAFAGYPEFLQPLQQHQRPPSNLPSSNLNSDNPIESDSDDNMFRDDLKDFRVQHTNRQEVPKTPPAKSPRVLHSSPVEERFLSASPERVADSQNKVSAKQPTPNGERVPRHNEIALEEDGMDDPSLDVVDDVILSEAHALSSPAELSDSDSVHGGEEPYLSSPLSPVSPINEPFPPSPSTYALWDRFESASSGPDDDIPIRRRRSSRTIRLPNRYKE